MYPQTAGQRVTSITIRLLLSLTACVLSISLACARTQLVESTTDSAVQRRIATLMNEAVAQRERLTPEGTKLWVPIPPSPKELQEIRGLGDKAVTTLLVYVRSGTYHERELAMELLHHVGGERMIEGLMILLRYDSDPGLRGRALVHVKELPWEIAEPILTEASITDPDQRVREQAEYIIESHKMRRLSSPSKGLIRNRIPQLIRHILKKGEAITSDGAAVWMPRLARPTKEEIEEIKRYGDDAALALVEHLTSNDDREKVLTLQLLGVLGGARIIASLESAVLNDPSPDVRRTALKAFADVPWQLAQSVIEWAAKNDPDETVREAATQILNSRR